jgi:thiol-disulfide isomerase/thioredoxin
MLRRTDGEPRKRRSVALVAAATAAALAFGLAACGSDAKNKDGLGTAAAFSLKDRKQFPMLSGTTLDGTRLDMASFRGKVIVVNIWGSWCDPCQQEAPFVEQAAEAYRDKGVQFVGIDTRDNTGQAQAFVKDKKISYPNLVDDGNETLLSKLAGITSLASVPSTLIVDRNGELAWRALRPVTFTDLSGALDTVLSGK